MMHHPFLILPFLFIPWLSMAQTSSPTPAETTAQKVVQVTPLPDDPACTAEDRVFMERAFEAARKAVKQGSGPFGAVLVKEGKVLAEFGNNMASTLNVTNHAETGLISAFSPAISRETFSECTLYASSEPCTMCSGAIRNARIGRVVYGVTELQFFRVWGRPIDENPLTCKEIFARTSPKTVVLGPLMEAEGLETHQSYWATRSFDR